MAASPWPRPISARSGVELDVINDDVRRVHVLNGEEHTHGVTAPDLGFAAWRNSVVLRTITGREVYPVEERIAFQTFGLPDDAATRPAPVPAGERAGGEAR